MKLNGKTVGYAMITPAQISKAVDEYLATKQGADTYLYNGVELPPLPEWDKEEYPYVYIAHRKFTTYELYIAYNTKEKLSINSSGSGDTDGINNTTFKCNVCQASSLDNYAWGAWADFVGGAYPPIWSNYDVLSLVDGSVYLAASDPVPVYAEEDKQKVIDLDEMRLSEAILALFEQEGGEINLDESVNWQPWDVLNTKKPVTVHFNLAPLNTEIYTANTTVFYTIPYGKAYGLGFDVTVYYGSMLVCVSVSVRRLFDVDTGTYQNAGQLDVKVSVL